MQNNKNINNSYGNLYDHYNYPDEFDEGLEHILDFLQNSNQTAAFLNMYANDKLKDYTFVIIPIKNDMMSQIKSIMNNIS